MTHQKVALVTGAGTGIGKASALALLNSGYQVIFVGRRQDVLETAIAQAGSSANQAQAIAIDSAERHIGSGHDATFSIAHLI